MEELRTQYRLKVTEDDIEKGNVGDSYTCMATRTIAKAIPDATRIQVDTQSVTFSLPHEGELVRLTYFTPPVLQAYVIAFDAGEELFPFGFRLKDPVVTRRQKTAKATEKAANQNRALKKRAIEGGATPEEAKAMATEAYREAKEAAFAKGHEIHQELISQGVENAAQKAAEAVGLLAVQPGNRQNNNPDPIFASTETRLEPGQRPPTPRVFKSRRRSYGQRALRINWPVDPATGNRVRPDVTRNV